MNKQINQYRYSKKISSTEKSCGSLKVIGDSNKFIGTYHASDELATAAPQNQVWKLSGKEYYIFNTGSKEGWRIGSKSGLQTGAYLFKSKFYKLAYFVPVLKMATSLS